MNELIKELMEQTGVPLSIPFDKWCEKFAELIVKECAGIADEPTSQPFRSYGEKIKEHFGVEE